MRCTVKIIEIVAVAVFILLTTNNKANLLIFGKQNKIFRQLQFNKPREKIFLNFRVQHVDHEARFS